MSDFPSATSEPVQSARANPSILVQSEAATNFFDMFGLEAGRHSQLGRAGDFANNPVAYNAIVRANDGMAAGIDYVHRIVRDETKNNVTRHEAAEKVAANLEKTLMATQATLEAASSESFSAGAALVNETMKADPNNAFRDSKLHDWIERKAAEGDTATIREAAMNDRDVAIMLWGSKPFLLGINAEVLGRLKMDAVKAHVPKAQALFDEATTLQAAAIRYPQIVRSMKASFFNRAIADKALSRVDV